MSTTQIIIILAFTTVGAMIQGSTGIGFTLVAGPALVALDPGFAPGPFLVVAQLISVRHIVAEFHEVDRRAVGHAFLGLPVGLGIGLLILGAMSASNLALLVGGLTAVSCAVLLAGFRPHRTPATEIAGGGACTFAAVTAGLPGPPLIITYHDMTPPSLRATVSSFVVVVASFGFVSLVITGNFGWHQLALTGWLLPGVGIGLLSARFVRPIIDRHWFRPAVLVIALLGGLALVIGQL
ncbi:MAG: TSUP family transporter [Actinomycetia bacterium]|nr:TSUP family transporter [Actinomycetes bacterium]MCP4225569.1 TSUP family transporter [Actinomycetes bacterium]MCP5033150.1 TSUP family transporter [Actinomycetes bacterium]